MQRDRRFDIAIPRQNAVEAAFITWLAGIPVRVGYVVKHRGPLLTKPATECLVA